MMRNRKVDALSEQILSIDFLLSTFEPEPNDYLKSEGVRITHGEPLNISRSPIPNGHLFPFYDHGDLAHAPRVF